MLLQMQNSSYSSMILMGAVFVVFYFFMIRPQQKKAKEAKKFIEELKAGDKVVTIGGAHGTVVTIREKTIVVEVDSSKGVRMVFEKTAISKDASSRLEE
ncbi:preprotein translocase subunit YajC [Aquirufa sp. HETE-83D]|uniref:Sec translocon accessory complex subunit YajC n=1 Tax=Aquirufa esocilacus TaxID=3096513 RepID=A0ABW6DJ23_9BACT